MFLLQFIINFLLFFISSLGIILVHKNVLVTLMSIELVLLSINLNFIIFSVYLDDVYGQIFALFVLTIAASESAIGLAIVISFFRLKGNIFINKTFLLKN